jgi:hypothetical protein
MEAIRMVWVTLVLVTGGVLALALVARLAARTKRRSTGPPTPHRPTTHLQADAVHLSSNPL